MPEQGEVKFGDLVRKSGREGQYSVVVTHADEAGDKSKPCSGQGGDVHAVLGIVVEVVQVHQNDLAEVVVGEVEVSDLGRDHRLGGGRQRGVPYSALLVVGEVADLVLHRERVATPVHGQHHVRLLDYLRAVQI